MKLVKKTTGSEVRVGDVVMTFRGEVGKVIGMAEPRHEGSTGRVYVRMDGAHWDDSMFPSVIGAEWVA